jgi:glycosyltransferase involved in cell wall biosynthesis
MLRVAIQAWLPQQQPSGAVTRLAGLLHGLAALPEATRLDCCLLTSRDAPLAPELEAAARALPRCCIEPLPIPAEPTWRRVRAESALLAAVTQARFDVLDLASLPVPPTPVPSVLTLHDLRDFGRFARTWRRLVTPAVLRQSLERAAAVIVPSPPVAAELRARFPRARCHVVPAGVTPGGGAECSPWPGCFVHAGRAEPRKELPFLFAAYRQARDLDPALPPLVLAGEARLGKAPKPGVIEAGVLSGPALRAVFREATALAFPSALEGFGLPVLEAMSEACPVLVLEGGVPAWLAAGAGVTLPRDERTWAAAMVRLARDAAWRQRLSDAARARAATFTPAGAARALLSVWQSVAAPIAERSTSATL